MSVISGIQPVGGAVSASAPTYTASTVQPASLNTSGAMRVDPSGVTQPVSAASLPLPTGAATSALQTTGNTSLSAMATSLGGILVAETVIDQAVRAGQAYIGSTGTVNLTALLGNFRILFSNPSGSGKTAYLYTLVAEQNSNVMVFSTTYANPTVVPSANSGVINNQKAGSSAGVCTIKYDSSATAMSGGTVYTTLGVPGGSGGSRTVYRETTFVIPAGVAMGVNVAFTGTSTANFLAYWYEQ